MRRILPPLDTLNAAFALQELGALVHRLINTGHGQIVDADADFDEPLPRYPAGLTVGALAGGPLKPGGRVKHRFALGFHAGVSMKFTAINPHVVRVLKFHKLSFDTI